MKNCLKGFAVAACLMTVLSVLVPAAKAEDVSWPTAIYFDQSVQIGSAVFPAGSYILQRCPNEVTLRLMKIYSVDRGKWEGFIMGAAARRPETDRAAIVTFERRGSGEPEALRYWFFEDWNIGMEFPAPHSGRTQSASNPSTFVTVLAQRADVR